MADNTRPILILGDAMLDTRVAGELTRIAQEAPVVVHQVRATTYAPGGAANVALNVAKLYCGPVFLAAAASRDAAAEQLQQCLRDVPNFQSTLVDADCTLQKIRYTSDGQVVFRADHGRQLRLYGDLPGAIEAAFQHPPGLAAVVVADYDKGTISDELARRIQALSRQYNVPLYVDSRPNKLYRCWSATVIKCNAPESRQLADLLGIVHPALISTDAADTSLLVARQLVQQQRAWAAVVTCGAGGAVGCNPEWSGHALARPRHVFDVLGAGDTFLAALAVSLTAGCLLPVAIERANLAAGLCVQRHGAYAVGRDELEDAVLEQLGWPGKIMGLPAVQSLIQRRRGERRRIVLTNGCFDSLHTGHLQLLQFAQSQGHCLIVAHNDDASIRRLKGESRPVTPSGHRAAQLAMFAPVSAVLEFDGDVEALVRQLDPDVLVKGGEYGAAVVPGADYVAQRGGEVVFFPMFPGLSTTAITEARHAN